MLANMLTTAPRWVSAEPTRSIGYSVAAYSTEFKERWDAFVRTASNATFLFYRDYMDYHRERFADRSLIVLRDSEIVALLPANLRMDGTLVSHEGLTFGGLLVRP